jgi:hypothetical protein
MDHATDPATAFEVPAAPTAMAPQPRPLEPVWLNTLAGQVALVSGASSGIGRAVAVALGRSPSCTPWADAPSPCRPM